MKSIRNSNIELLRIVAIFMIIVHHYYVHGGFEQITTDNEVFLRIIGGGGKAGIAIFVLITGYFGDKIKPGRIIKLIRDRWIYSFLITAVLLVFGLTQMSSKLAIHTIAPTLTCRHNYFTTFCMLYLFIPFLNKIVDSFSRRTIESGIVLSVVLFSLFPTIYPDFSNNTYSYILWMMLLFVIGRCLNKYEYNLPWKWILLLSIAGVMICLFIIEPHISYYQLNRIVSYLYSVPVLVIPICLVMLFSKLSIQSTVINQLAKSTFAVYIIHDDPYVRAVIWSRLFRNPAFGMSTFLPLHLLGTAIAVYCGSVLIDKILRASLFRVVDCIPWQKIEKKVNSLYIDT